MVTLTNGGMDAWTDGSGGGNVDDGDNFRILGRGGSGAPVVFAPSSTTGQCISLAK